MHLARPVHPDGQLLLDVGAPARARHDRERARKVGAERREELGEPGKDPVLPEHRHVDGGEKRAGTRLVWRGG